MIPSRMIPRNELFCQLPAALEEGYLTLQWYALHVYDDSFVRWLVLLIYPRDVQTLVK